MREHYLSIAPELAEENKRLAELRKSMPAQPTTLVMQERRRNTSESRTCTIGASSSVREVKSRLPRRRSCTHCPRATRPIAWRWPAGWSIQPIRWSPA